MQLTRRRALALGAGVAAAAALPASAAQAALDEAIAAFTGGAAAGEGGITLTTPEIAENGNSVPVTVSAPGAAAITLLATRNPNPEVATFTFGPLAGSPTASTRIRLATSQQVIAIARMADGSFRRTAKEVMITVGGCEA